MTCLSLVPVTDADRFSLADLMASSMAPIARTHGLAWNPGRERAALRRSLRPGEDRVIRWTGRTAGVFSVRDQGTRFYLLHLVIDPAFRGLGIGSTLLRRLTGRGADRGLPVELTVFSRSPARGLYERVGFRPVLETDTRARMRYTPDSAACDHRVHRAQTP